MKLTDFKNKPLKGIFNFDDLLFIAMGKSGFRIESLRGLANNSLPILHKVYSPNVLEGIMNVE